MPNPVGHPFYPPAYVECPPGVPGEGGDLPGDELDGVSVEDPQPGEPRRHDLPQLIVRVGREGEAGEAEAGRHAVHHDPLRQVHRVGDRQNHQPENDWSMLRSNKAYLENHSK